MSRISILGSGGFGCSIGIMWNKNGHNVKLWSFSDQEVNEIIVNRENKHYLPGVKIPDDIQVTADIDQTLDADIIVIAVPSFAVRDTVRKLKGKVSSDKIIVSVSKGLEESSLKLLSDVIAEELPNNKIVILSGPSHAEEIVRDIFTAVVVSSKSDDASIYVQELLKSDMFRIYINNDIIGVQLGGAFKNIISLASGISNGLKFGDNTRAAIITRGLYEIAKLGMALGAKYETFTGLSGMGDLIVTCTSMHSRNFRTGLLIGQGKSVQEAIEEIGMTVEGINSTKCAYLISNKYSIDTPIISEMYKLIYENKSIDKTLNDLIKLPYKYEF